MRNYLVEVLAGDRVLYSFMAIGNSIPGVLTDKTFRRHIGREEPSADGIRIREAPIPEIVAAVAQRQDN